MPWVEGYTSTDTVSLPRVEWPQGKQCCAVVVVDYSVPTGLEGVNAAAVDAAEALYACSVGGEWLLDDLQQYGVYTTFVVPPYMAERFPQVVARAAQEGHEIAVGGIDKADVSRLGMDEEREEIANAGRCVSAAAGVTPVGWFSLPRTADDTPGGTLSPHTMPLLAEAGYRYFGNGMADDIPYYTVMDASAKTAMLTLPYYYPFDSQFFMFFPGIGKGSGLVNVHKLEQNWHGELHGALHFGRQFVMVLQPCLMRWGYARDVLRGMFSQMRDARVWQATSQQCAGWWLLRYPWLNQLTTAQ